MTNAWWPIVLNITGGVVLAGVILAGLAALVFFGRKVFKRRGFKRIFGPVDGRSGNFNIVYASLDLKPAYDKQGQLVQWPYTKNPKNEEDGFSEFQIGKAVSSYETRAAGYIASSVGREQGFNPLVLSDTEIHTRYDLSFVSLGGPWSNYKSRQALTNPANKLVTFGLNRASGDFDRLVAVSSGKVLARSTVDQDFGLIARIRPRQFPERVWLVCAGLGERGTSGAAWYLANRWRDLLANNQGADKDFAAIIRVGKDSDESASVFAFFNDPAEVKAWPKFKSPARPKSRAAFQEKSLAAAEPETEPAEAVDSAPAPEPAPAIESEPAPASQPAVLEQAPEPVPVSEPVSAPASSPVAGPESAPVSGPKESLADYQSEGPVPPLGQGPTPTGTPEVYRSGEPDQPLWPEGEMPQRSVMAQLNRFKEPDPLESRDGLADPLMSRRPVEVDPRPVDSHYPMPMIDTPPAQSADYTPRNNRGQGAEEEEESSKRRSKEVSYV